MSRTKILIIILAFVIGGLVGLNLLNRLYQPLKVVSVSPFEGAENVALDTSLKIQFNREPEVLSLMAHPEIDFSLGISHTTATLVLNQPLKPETKYSLAVLYQEKEVFSWSFTTRELTENESVEEEVEMSKKSYPLIDFVPYETENFKISYEAPLFLQIEIKKGKVDLIKEEVLDWILSKGVNPATHKIEWLTPGP